MWMSIQIPCDHDHRIPAEGGRHSLPRPCRGWLPYLCSIL